MIKEYNMWLSLYFFYFYEINLVIKVYSLFVWVKMKNYLGKSCKILKFVLCDLMNWNDFVNNFILWGGNF